MSHLASILPRSFKTWLWQQLSRRMHLQYQLPSGMSVTIGSYADWCMYNDIFVAGEYDPAIHAALERAIPDGVFHAADLGANVGFFTLRLVDLIRRHKIPLSKIELFLVEASPRLVGLLKERLAPIARDGLQINIIHGLVGERVGEGQLQIAESEIRNVVVDRPSADSLPVGYVDLDALFGRVDRIDLLKCDIEGSETAFLNNYDMLLKKTEVAVFELHQPACHLETGVTKLRQAGFTSHEVLSDEGTMQTVLFQRASRIFPA